MYLYNVGLRLAVFSCRMVWSVKSLQKLLTASCPKLLKFVMGQKDLLDTIRCRMENENREVYWFHAASNGEYNVIRPVVRQMKSSDRRIVVTFFSPSGYELLSEENKFTNEADDIFYLPLDTPSNVRTFLSFLRPHKAIFAVSEYWINYFSELHRLHIPVYIVSMLVGNDSYLLKWYGRPIVKALKAVRTFMVLDEDSKCNLANLGFMNVIITGDPLFDNAIKISKEPYHNIIIEKFCAGGNKIFVAGSVSDKRDLSLVSALANANRDVKFIVVPHEISEETLNKIKYCMDGKTLLYSESEPTTNFDGTQVLVIDFLGALSRIYRYGNWAYVGGGFTPFLHSVIEPVVYGIPVSFGPRIERKQTPNQMIRLGIGCVVKSKSDIKSWFIKVNDDRHLIAVRRTTRQYIEKSSNVTDKVRQAISECNATLDFVRE